MSMGRIPLKTQIRSALRRIWLYSELRKNVLAKARVARGIYRCTKCGELVGPKMIDVDHVETATPPNFEPEIDPTQWGLYIKRLLYPKDEPRAMCKPCHKTKTAEERDAKKIKKKTRKKATKRVKRLRTT